MTIWSGHLLKREWEKFGWSMRTIDVDGSPIPAAIWVDTLLTQFNFTYNELDGWLESSADDPEWDCAIYAGFNKDGVAYIVAKNVDVS